MSEEKVQVRVTWMERRHRPEVLAIEVESFEFPWSKEDFIRCLQRRNYVGMVAEHDERVAGFMIYEFNKICIQVLNFAAAVEHRRRGVGSQMVAKLIAKLSNGRRERIVADVRETNLGALEFFRKMGFRATIVVHDPYKDVEIDGDAYRMEYKLKGCEQHVPRNRLKWGTLPHATDI